MYKRSGCPILGTASLIYVNSSKELFDIYSNSDRIDEIGK